MSDADIDARFAACQSIAERAGAIALGHWRDRAALTIEAKAGPQDIVSEADRAVERAIRDAVAVAFPDDGFLGEEYGLVPGRSGFDWVVDPIDGTSPFLHGIPNWCVSIAVVRGGETVVGVIAAPTHDEVYSARIGLGARLNGVPLAIPAGVGIGNASTGIGASHRSDPAGFAISVETLLRQGGMVFINGSGALMLAYVAGGRLAGYIEAHMHSWDCLAGLLLVREAGGRTAPFCADGDLSHGDRVLAAAPGAWDALAHVMGS